MSLVGRRIGKYDVRGCIGRGGAGTVYLATDADYGDRVALRTLHPELVGNAEAVARFLDAARKLQSLDHPNVARVYAYGTDVDRSGDVVYAAVEFVEGRTLADKQRRERLATCEALSVARQCTSALAATHALGVVHADLRPDHVILTGPEDEDPRVKLIDFGLARRGVTGQTAAWRRTPTSPPLATPAYLAPEQCDGRGIVDHRVDVYALGVMLFELLTGRVPFRGDGFGEIVAARLSGKPPSPSAWSPWIPATLDAIILHAMERDRDRRFQSMDALQAALRDPTAHLRAYEVTKPRPATPGRTTTASRPLLRPLRELPTGPGTTGLQGPFRAIGR